MPAKVFLAHASEDKGLVRRIYAELVDRGLKPWLDEIDLLPGQNWQVEIPRAIRECDLLIGCFSRLSVRKHGYVQREFRSALNVHAEKPPDSIYLIPLRLDECEIPDFRLPELGVSLRDIQWADYWKPGGLDRLIKAIAAATKAAGDSRDEVASPPEQLNLEKAEEVAVKWFTALRGQNLRSLVSLSEKPFFDGDGDGRVLLSDDEIQARYTLPDLKSKKAELQISHLRANTVADWKALNVLSGKERVFSAIRVSDSDLIVMARMAIDFSQGGIPEEKVKEIPEKLRGMPLRILLQAQPSGIRVRGYWSYG